MDTIQAAGVLLNVVNTAMALLGNAQRVAALLQQVQKEGRTALTPEEWAVVIGVDDAAKQKLQEAIAQAGG